jgi:hypothetical protein
VDRIVLNAYYPLGHNLGGFRTWWRRLIGGSDAEADAVLENTHLMRLAGRFARRVRARAADNGVPVIDCTAGERKHLIAEEYLHAYSGGLGVFMILVARAPRRWCGMCAGHAPFAAQVILNGHEYDDLDREVRVTATDEPDQLEDAAERTVKEREGHRRTRLHCGRDRPALQQEVSSIRCSVLALRGLVRGSGRLTSA